MLARVRGRWSVILSQPLREVMTEALVPAAAVPLVPPVSPAPLIRHIAWSARILAATRAEETQRTASPPLVIDPLAHILAYPDGDSRASDSSSSISPTSDAEYNSRRMWLHHTHFHFRRVRDKRDLAEVERLRVEADAINREAAERPDTLIRCRYIDQCIAAEAVTVAAAPAVSTEAAARSASPAFKQLVLLGAGLDTRAYRCAALAGVRVYEVDRAEVLAYKQSVLQRNEVKAELKAQSVEYIVGELTQASTNPAVEKPTNTMGKKGVSRTAKKKREKAESELDLTKARDRRALQAIQLKRSKQQQQRHIHSPAVDPCQPQPYSAESSTSASTSSSAVLPPTPAPVPIPAWSTALLASPTFDPSLPTCWVLEGLCMYLTPTQLEALLSTAASLCSSPSLLCFDHVTSRLGRWHRLFSSSFSRDECVRLVEQSGWRVGQRRDREERRGLVGYEAGDGVVGIGRSELSYGRYLRDVLVVQDGNGRQVEVQSYIVTAHSTRSSSSSSSSSSNRRGLNEASYGTADAQLKRCSVDTFSRPSIHCRSPSYPIRLPILDISVKSSTPSRNGSAYKNAAGTQQQACGSLASCVVSWGGVAAS